MAAVAALPMRARLRTTLAAVIVACVMLTPLPARALDKQGAAHKGAQAEEGPGVSGSYGTCTVAIPPTRCGTDGSSV